MPFEFKIKQPDAMTAFGCFLARHLQGGDIITLSGGLGAGKSTLARGLITKTLADGGFEIDDIPSPSFTLVQSYPWPSSDDEAREVWHIDLWRLEDVSEIIELGFEEALGCHAMIIEWPERLGGVNLASILPITITIDADEGRIVTLVPDPESRWVDVFRDAPDFS